MTEPITLVDRGRGLQLSTSRITVLDLIPYFQEGNSYEEIMRWLPTLSRQEIAVVEAYYREHQAEMDELDRRATEYRERQIQLQKARFPDSGETTAERMARWRKILQERGVQKNGKGHAG